jgi:hypothetical protein
VYRLSKPTAKPMNDVQHRISKVYRSREILWGTVNFFDENVAQRIDLLTPEQREKILELCIRVGNVDWLSKMHFMVESVRLDHEPDTVFHVPNGNVHGVWPHCNLYGGMDEKGDIRT